MPTIRELRWNSKKSKFLSKYIIYILKQKDYDIFKSKSIQIEKNVAFIIRSNN